MKKSVQMLCSRLLGAFVVLTMVSFAGISHAQEAFVGDRVYGDDAAPVTVVEYASLTCPHCRTFHETVWPEFKETYVDTGKVKFIFREFPFNLPDLRAVTLARCAGEARYGAFVDILFKRQGDWVIQQGFDEVLASIGLQGGVSREQFAACQTNEALQESILERRQMALDAGLQSTPSFVVDGKVYAGVQTMEDWAGILGSGASGGDVTSQDDSVVLYGGAAVAILALIGGFMLYRRRA